MESRCAKDTIVDSSTVGCETPPAFCHTFARVPDVPPIPPEA
jgi:hypothetical protein